MRHWLTNAREWLTASRHKLATAGVALLAATAVYPIIFGANGLLVYHQKRAESRQLQRQIQLLEQENRESEQRIRSLKYDPQAIEKEARERLRYARKGEKVYIFPTRPQELRQEPETKEPK